MKFGVGRVRVRSRLLCLMNKIFGFGVEIFKMLDGFKFRHGRGVSGKKDNHLMPQFSGAESIFGYNGVPLFTDRKSTRLNSSHVKISYAVFCLKKKKASTSSKRTWRARR